MLVVDNFFPSKKPALLQKYNMDKNCRQTLFYRELQKDCLPSKQLNTLNMLIIVQYSEV